MSHKADISSFDELSQQQFSKFEKRLMQLTPAFPYPPTPDFTRRERQRLEANRNSNIPQRRLAIGLVLLFIALAATLLITPVRAQILDWFRIGSVKIFISSPTDSSSPGTPAPAVTQTFLETILDLAGETTLVDAREQADFSIGLPSYPSDLPMPDKVFVQKFNGPVVTLVWMDSSLPDKVKMSLSESRSDKAIFEKYDPVSLQETQVNDNPAVWVDSDYMLIMRNGETAFSRLVDQGHTLIWTNGAITYRLETDEVMDVALRIAESIP